MPSGWTLRQTSHRVHIGDVDGVPHEVPLCHHLHQFTSPSMPAAVYVHANTRAHSRILSGMPLRHQTRLIFRCCLALNVHVMHGACVRRRRGLLAELPVHTWRIRFAYLNAVAGRQYPWPWWPFPATPLQTLGMQKSAERFRNAHKSCLYRHPGLLLSVR